jgi:hypothetical protein
MTKTCVPMILAMKPPEIVSTPVLTAMIVMLALLTLVFLHMDAYTVSFCVKMTTFVPTTLVFPQPAVYSLI